MKCTLCGHEFDEEKAQKACKTCPMTKGCKLIRCPNCGFETPPEPKWLKRKGTVMTKLAVNQKGKVTHIDTMDRKKLQKIMAMGVLPGMSVTLIQKFPSYVFQVGQSQFAVDKELASCIFVGPKD